MKYWVLLGAIAMSGCSYPIEVVSKDGDTLLRGHLSGVCLIGCGWRFRDENRSKCSGFSIGAPYSEDPLSLAVNCEANPRPRSEVNDQNLMVENYVPHGSSAATYNGVPVVVKFK